MDVEVSSESQRYCQNIHQSVMVTKSYKIVKVLNPVDRRYLFTWIADVDSFVPIKTIKI